jgi:dihydroneopterin aldolase
VSEAHSGDLCFSLEACAIYRTITLRDAGILTGSFTLSLKAACSAADHEVTAMTLFLASVTNAREAEIAISGGADLIDFKDPTKGAFGALEAERVRSGVAAVAGRRPTSAVTGNLPMDAHSLALAVKSMAEAGVDYVKIGFFQDPRRADCIASLAPLAAATKLIGVIFADEPPTPELVERLAAAGFHGAMLDTARKDAGRLFDHRDPASLADFVAACRAKGLLAGLAGSLEPPDVPRLLPLRPDILGFRSALCPAADRKAGVDLEAVSLIRGLIPIDERSRAIEREEESRVDYRLLVARGYAVDLRDGASRTDRIFVRDFVLPISIGAYRNELNVRQRVRFNVDVFVQRGTHVAADMRDVLSYDVITDSIRRIVAEGHIDLVETLAERIASAVLDQPRATKVVVRVEKLDLGPGAVGVEITREKTAEAAILPHAAPVGGGERGGTG